MTEPRFASDYRFSAQFERQACKGLVYEVDIFQVQKMLAAGEPIHTVRAMVVVDFYGVKQPARVLEVPATEFEPVLVELFRNRQN